MKTYDHKTKKFFAEKDDKSAVYTIRDTMARFIGKFPPELIENSSDRELVVEKDWVSKVCEEYEEIMKSMSVMYVVSSDSLREIIEKHAPKQKKFTRDDVEEAVEKIGYNARSAVKEWLYTFLKEHNLLSDTD